MYPSNIWLINESEFESFVYSGGRVIYIVEEGRPAFNEHPAVVSAGVLLPPTESIMLEIDDRPVEAASIYENYLMHEADNYISVIVAAAIQQTPIALMFGTDEVQMQFPKVLLNFLYHAYGIVVGVANSGVKPYIEIQKVPDCLAKLYMMNIIDYEMFMLKHPPLPINGVVISKMAYEQNPIVPVKDFEHYYQYFENMRKEIYSSGKFLIDPFIAS